jgi:outer membrane protein OmpU
MIVMNNFKKVGMTALAASLVSTSVFAGELTVAGSAGINWENYSGKAKNSTKSFSMGNQITFSGSGELDNGMNVSLSFVIDEFDNAANESVANSGSVFDAHSVTVSSDAMGTLKFSGEGGSSAHAAINTTAAGDIWDNFDGKGGTKLRESRSGDNLIHYTLPSLVDDLTASVSYSHAAGNDESDSAWALTYAGVDGLSISYGQGSNDAQAAGSGGTTTNTDSTTLSASYVYGSITVAYSDHESDSNTSTSDQDATSYKISYAVTDDLSVSYGTEEIDSNGAAELTDAEYSKISTSYTSGGMTVSANYQDGDNISYTTADSEDWEYYGLSLSFAF